MPKVKVSKEALTGFERAAAAQGVPVGQWLTAAGLRSLDEGATNVVEVWQAIYAEVIDLVVGPGQKGVVDRLRPVAVVDRTMLFAAVDFHDRITFEIQLRPTVEHALSRHLGRRTRAAVTLDDQEQPPVDADVDRATVPGGE